MATNTKAKKRSFGTTMGVTSIIAILVILILIVFAALSITTSNADLNLSKKTAVATKAYYEADTNAEKILADIHEKVSNSDDWVSAIYVQSVYQATIEPADGGQSVKYSVTIDENKDLHVELLVAADGKITRKEWRVMPSGEWTPDTDLNVITEFPLS